MKEETLNNVREQFEADFERYDQKVRDVLPGYDEMQTQLIEAIDFPKGARLSLLDLGIGTGYSADELLKKFPNATITGVDVSPKMLEVAKKRLEKKSERIRFFENDMKDFEPPQNYDACVGILSIHHLTNEQKQDLYKKVFKHLNPEGIFAIGDLRIGESAEEIRDIENEWEKYLVSKFGREGADEWLKIYHEQDIPASIRDQIKWLSEAGFEAELKWTKGNLALIIGKRI